MSCARCQSFFEQTNSERERKELNGIFSIVEETIDKYDSATMWWHGTAQCISCGQKAHFEYLSGFQNTGTLTKK